MNSARKLKILFVQKEYANWSSAKMWGYCWHLGIEEGLRNNNVEVTTIVSSWMPRAKEIVGNKIFDQVWINDITHQFKPGGPENYNLTLDDLVWLASLAPVRLGILVESLNYTLEQYESNPILYETKQLLIRNSPYITHLVYPDEKDTEEIWQFSNTPALWYLVGIPRRFFCSEVSRPPSAKPVFLGTPYGERALWLEHHSLNGLLIPTVSKDNLTDIPARYDALHGNFLNALLKSSTPDVLYGMYLCKLRGLLSEAYAMYLDSWLAGCAVVNLPAFASIHTALKYEGMALGRPVIALHQPENPRQNRHFEDGKDILLYPRDNPEILAEHIRHILRDPEFGYRIAVNAHAKMLRLHTVEKRVKQFMDWIESGQTPDYAEDRVSHGFSISHSSEGKPSTSAVAYAESAHQAQPERTLRILLINPPYRRFLNLSNNTFPLTFGNMATMVAQAGHAVAVYDADFDRTLLRNSYGYQEMFTHQHLIGEGLNDVFHPVWQEIDRTIKAFKPDVVGITAMTPKYPMVEKVAEIAKSIDPGITVVIGGHHPSIVGEQIFRNGNIDVVVVGEGEITFSELVHSLARGQRNLEDIPGILFRNADRKIVRTASRPPIENLDLLPITNRELILNRDYVSDNNIISTRGCPFSCAYCGADVIWKHKQRRRSVANVMEEVRYLISRSGSRMISFWDDSFTVNMKHTLELLDALKSIPGLTFSCITRLDLINYEIVTALKQAGCTTIYFGIESGNDRILALMNKHLTKELVREKTALVNESGISWLGFFIMGYPGETREDILETLDFMKELDPPYAEINIFNPLPGTQTWRELEAEGKVCTTMDFSRHSQSSTDNLFIDMPPEEFRELSLYVAREFDAHNARKARQE